MRIALTTIVFLTCCRSLSAQQDTKSKDKPSGKFGDMALTVTDIVLFPPQNGRATLEVFVTAANTGKGVICANLNATLNTTFDLHYFGGSVSAPRINEMLPGESTKVAYAFGIKDGVQPLELVFRLGDGGHSIRCASASSAHDAPLPSELHLDVRDVPLKPPLPTSRLPWQSQ